MRALYFLWIIFLVWSCSSSTTTENPKQGQSAGNEPKEESSSFKFPSDKNFYKHYSGKIGEVAVHMSLIKIGNQLRATYYYDKYGRPITLRDGKVDKSGEFYFIEYSPNYEKTGSLSGAFIEKGLSGNWFDADSSQSFPLELKESLDAYSLPMEVFYEEQVSFLKEGNPQTPKHTFIFSTLFPSSKHESKLKDSVYNTFESIFGEMMVAGNPRETILQMQEKAVKGYRDANMGLYSQDTSMAYAMNWSEVSHIDALYNDNDIVSLKWDWYTYSGGAHGNFGAKHYVISLKTGQQIKLEEVLPKENHVYMKSMIEQKIFEQQQQYAGDAKTLRDIGFDTESIVPTENFYLTHRGIGFYYEPYQIAPYALGAIEAFIPFSECGELLSLDKYSLM